MKNTIAFFLFLCVAFTQSNQPSEIMSETPLHPIPEEMTYEEYQDMNRRINIGVGLAFIPIPGIVHRYAGEKNTAKKLQITKENKQAKIRELQKRRAERAQKKIKKPVNKPTKPLSKTPKS